MKIHNLPHKKKNINIKTIMRLFFYLSHLQRSKRLTLVIKIVILCAGYSARHFDFFFKFDTLVVTPCFIFWASVINTAEGNLAITITFKIMYILTQQLHSQEIILWLYLHT